MPAGPKTTARRLPQSFDVLDLFWNVLIQDFSAHARRCAGYSKYLYNATWLKKWSSRWEEIDCTKRCVLADDRCEWQPKLRCVKLAFLDQFIQSAIGLAEIFALDAFKTRRFALCAVATARWDKWLISNCGATSLSDSRNHGPSLRFLYTGYAEAALFHRQ